MKITDILLAEHIVFHQVFDHLERELPNMKTVSEVRTLAALLESLLRDHSHTEDELVLAPLEHCLEQMGQRDSFEHEHHEIDASLLRVRDAKQVAEARRLLQRAVAYSRKHFDREERIVFPLAEKVMKRETLTQLGRAWIKKHEWKAT